MTKKTKKLTTEKGFPVDDRPVIFNLIDGDDINFIGRYIESEAMFMLSLNDIESDFVPQTEINQWWYITEHPILLDEVLNKKSFKKSRIKKDDDKKYKRKVDDSENKTDSEVISNTHTFSATNLSTLPPFINDFVKNFQQQTGMQFQQVNVRVVGEDELGDLPKEVLEQLLQKAVADEHWELATKVRDAINSK